MKQNILLLLFAILLVACGGSQDETTTVPVDIDMPLTEAAATDAPTVEPTNTIDTSSDSTSVIDLNIFDSAALVQEPTVVDCTLQDGTATECAQIVVKYLPDNLQIGPFCPDNIYEDAGGIWVWDGDNPGLYRLDEAFFTMLTEQGYEFYDADGNVYVGDPGGGGLVAGVNNCLEAVQDDTVEMTAIIPLNPVSADSPTQLGTVARVGIGIDGVPIFADAPSVLDTGHLPALDTCGGHIDPGGWYHWHATATDIESSYEHEGIDADCHLDQDASALFAYAFDGYPIYGAADPDGTIPTDLDECGGHFGATAEYPDGIYHYHAGLEFPNLPTCLMGVSANNAFATTASGGIGAGGGPGGGPGGGGQPGGGRPEGGQGGGLDFAAVAATLGVTEQELRDALGGPPPDVEAGATALGISVEELQAALDGVAPATEEPAAEDDTADHEHGDDTHTHSDSVDLNLFFDGALAEDVTVVDCTLTDGTETMCYEITVIGTPVNHDVGPFCPTSITDSADAGGLWLDGENSYVIDGPFFTELADIYGDELWNNIYNDDGSINVIDNAEDFQVAARPDITEEYYYHCVDGDIAWVGDGVQPTKTIQVPVTPVLTDAPTIEFAEGAHSDLGVTFNGAALSGSADMTAILSSYTIAAFDDCGGHINPALGYHVHGTAGCSDVDGAEDGETAPFALAVDGHTVHAPYADGVDVELDECNGHYSEQYGYHYHANSLEENATLTCLMGLTAEGQGGGPGGGGQGGPPPGGPSGGGQGGGIDFAAAAETLGVSEDELREALGGPPPDFEAAAETLGISIEALQEALDGGG